MHTPALIEQLPPLVPELEVPEDVPATVPPRLRRIAATCVALTVAMGLVAGCSEQHDTIPEVGYAQEVASNPPQLPGEVTPLPTENTPSAADTYATTSCAPQFEPNATSFEKQQIREVYAADCQDLLQNGRVGLVDFGLPKGEASTVASIAEDLVSETSGGIVHFDVVVVPASAQAQKAWAEKRGGACVPMNGKSAAAVALQTMPELQEYDTVISASNNQSCEGVLGVAIGNRADMYGGTIMGWVSDMGANRAREWQEKGSTVAHESIHNLAGGHDGRMMNSSYTFVPNKVFDVDTFVKGGRFDENGGPSIMGASADGKLNVVMRNCLNWPQEYLEGVPEIQAEPVSEDGATVSFNEAAHGHYVNITFEQPMPIPGQKADAPPFDGLAVVPIISQSSVQGLSFILTREQGCSVANVGSIQQGRSNGEAAISFTIGGTAYEAVATPDMLEVTPA